MAHSNTQDYTGRSFTRAEIESRLTHVQGMTLADADVKGIIAKAVKTRPDKVVRGIAGDVIEQSVLGCNKDSAQAPDILVDNIQTELKSTGVRKPKKDLSREYEAKEPLTITGISDSIIDESFDSSHFYEKIEHLLFVFYHYTLTSTAHSSADYAQFPILGHLFWEVPEKELTMLQNDWMLVQQFFADVKNGIKGSEAFSQLQNDLLLIDTSSPQRPRFRFKRSFVCTIVDTFLSQLKNQDKGSDLSLPQAQQFTKFADIDKKCHEFASKYKGMTIDGIGKDLGISFQNKNGGYEKDSCQKIIVSMFGSNANSLNQIKDFKEIGLTAKTIILTSEGKKTEDMKLCPVDFNEWCNPYTTFADTKEEGLFATEYSDIYSYFAEQSFIFILFEEPYKPAPKEKIPLGKCKFLGFKRYSFNEAFIMDEVQKTWAEARDLVLKKTLKEEKSGARGPAPNFPKAKDHTVFFRGSGSTPADRKPRLLKWGIDIDMYIQYVWIRGDFIVKELSKQTYI